uniref:Uncharacterized protein n=1 Tax=Paramormyrops kingsleyae TaxID=1676925 RepID=A0A3B3SWS8_9TELE
MTAHNRSLGICSGAADASCAGGTDAHLGGTRQLTLSATGLLTVAICLGSIGTFGFLKFLVLVLFCCYGVPRSPINLPFAASAQGRRLAGDFGCVWGGFANSLLGIVSFSSPAVLSYGRCCTMTSPTEADPTNHRWSAYSLQGPGTTCSVSMNRVSYIISLFMFCLVLPFLIIVYSYGKLLHAVKQVGLKTS